MGDSCANNLIILRLAVIVLILCNRATGGSWKNLERKLMQDYPSEYFEDKNRIHFPDEDFNKPSWHPDVIPKEEDNQQRCLSSCAVSREYYPVCGTNGATYQNIGQLQCAMACGIEVHLHHRFPCATKPPYSTTTSAPITAPMTNFEQESCIRTCPSTPEYNPVCGTNYVTYNNRGKLECAKYCGVDVQFWRHYRCPNYLTSSTTPSPPTTSELSIELISCIHHCPATSQYDPVCGTDNVTYYNLGKLECAKACGVDVNFKRHWRCSITSNNDDHFDSDHFHSKNSDEDYDDEINIRYPGEKSRKLSFK